MAPDASARPAKSTLRFSVRFTDLHLHRIDLVTHTAIFSSVMIVTIWTIIVDYLKPDLWVLAQNTYILNDAIDMGTISNIRHGNFGWPIMLILFFTLAYLIVDLLSSDSFLIVSVTGIVLCMMSIVCFITCCIHKLGGKDSSFISPDESKMPFFKRLNLSIAVLSAIATITYQAAYFGLIERSLWQLSSLSWLEQSGQVQNQDNSGTTLMSKSSSKSIAGLKNYQGPKKIVKDIPFVARTREDMNLPV